MIQEVVQQWYERKDALEAWLRAEHPGSYKRLVVKLVELVLTEPLRDDYALSVERLTVIDDGDYQGTQLFLIPLGRYQPRAEDYVWLSNYYGSCSGCDTLQAIANYSSEPPTESQVEQYMSLALHMVQRMKWLSPPE